MQKDGLRQCKKQQKEGKQVYYMTDKSKMLSVDTPENYVKAMRKHIESDIKVSVSDITNMEKTLNGHANMFVRFLNMGKDWEHQNRIKQAKQEKKIMVFVK